MKDCKYPEEMQGEAWERILRAYECAVKEDPKTESMSDMAEMTCGECDQMRTEFCLHRCIYKVLFDDKS